MSRFIPLLWQPDWRLASLLLVLSAFGYAPSVSAAEAAIPVWQVSASQKPGVFVADAVVEAVRDAKISSQVAGRITRLGVVAGDKVSAGSALLSVDTSVVQQQLAASQAQLAQTQAQAAVARSEFERAQLLFKKNYLSQSALDQSGAQLKAADAQVKALQAQLASMQAQTALHSIKAPFNGVVAQVLVSLGDSANPGQPLLSLYDPSALRLSAQIPESIAQRLLTDQAPQLALNRTQNQADIQAENQSIQGLSAAAAAALRPQVLPAVDPQSRTVTVRVALPAGITALSPGQAGKLSLPLRADSPAEASKAAASAAQIWIPQAAVAHRGELTAVYVQIKPEEFRLRQVRLGKTQGQQVQVLSGLLGQEKIALEPIAAARSTQHANP